MSALYIDTVQALDEFCQTLRRCAWIALDTEFIREKTYFPRLCLIQVASEEAVACIDPLAIEDLSSLLAVLYDPAITKVLHAAFQDLEIFFHLGGKVPEPIFDTQIAATLLGHGDQLGYAALVAKMLNIELDKSQTRTDWSRRPLQASQLAYAVDDVRYLRDVYRQQREALGNSGRLAWLEDDFAALCDPDNYRIQPRQAWRRIKASRQLRGIQLTALRTLATWREKKASQNDRPRQWILSDEALLELSRTMPEDWNQLKRVRRLNSGQLRRFGQELLAAIAAARREAPENGPTVAEHRQLNDEQEALVAIMAAMIHLRATQHAVSPQLLSTRKELERLARGEQDVALLRGWRFILAGRDIQRLLQGQACLQVHNRDTLKLVSLD